MSYIARDFLVLRAYLKASLLLSEHGSDEGNARLPLRTGDLTMPLSDGEYYRIRAVDARQREAAASCEASMRAPSEMAELYEQLSGDSDGQVGPEEVAETEE